MTAREVIQARYRIEFKSVYEETFVEMNRGTS